MPLSCLRRARCSGSRRGNQEACGVEMCTQQGRGPNQRQRARAQVRHTYGREIYSGSLGTVAMAASLAHYHTGCSSRNSPPCSRPCCLTFLTVACCL
jgi:hypothetical protein